MAWKVKYYSISCNITNSGDSIRYVIFCFKLSYLFDDTINVEMTISREHYSLF